MEPFPENWSWSPGREIYGLLPVYGGGAEIPVTLLCGNTPGPAVLVMGGIHSAEYVGIEAVLELTKQLNTEEISGSVALITLANPTGFEHRTMSLVYEDEKNLNRVFPGSPEGTLADRIAWTISEYFIKKADAVIDLHSGDGYEELTPFVFFQGTAEPDTRERSQAMAELVDVPYVVPSDTATGGAYNYAGSAGVPGILIERGGMGLWTWEEVERDKADVCRILHHLGVLSWGPPAAVKRKTLCSHFNYELSEFSGFWYPAKRAGEPVFEDDILGEVRDYFGRTLQFCRARESGVLLYQAKSLSVQQGGPMAAYVTLP